MTLDRIRLFKAVANHLNITKASEELHVSQSSISQRLKLLEKELQVRLYSKSVRGIELTKAGLMLLSSADTIFIELEKFKRAFNAGVSPGKVESFTVAGTYGPSTLLLPALLAIFRESHPQVEITLRSNNAEAIGQMILNYEAEIAMVYGPFVSRQCIVEPYRQEKLAIFAPVDHPLARRRGLTLDDLAQTPLVLRREKGAAELILKPLEKQGLKPDVRMYCESPDAVKAAVRMKMGLGILFQDTIEHDVMRGDFKIIKIPGLILKGESFIIYHKEKPLSANARDFLALLYQRRDEA
jgi:DNA-binding transcriptional LysR family regulator